jgi:hypothetical protein
VYLKTPLLQANPVPVVSQTSRKCGLVATQDWLKQRPSKGHSFNNRNNIKATETKETLNKLNLGTLKSS